MERLYREPAIPLAMLIWSTCGDKQDINANLVVLIDQALDFLPRCLRSAK